MLMFLVTDNIQVMACSNNVVRAALTPKFRDVNLLVEMLTYNMGGPAVLPAEAVDQYRKRYTPPINDFEIQVIEVSPETPVTRPGTRTPLDTRLSNHISDVCSSNGLYYFNQMKFILHTRLKCFLLSKLPEQVSDWESTPAGH